MTTTEVQRNKGGRKFGTKIVKKTVSDKFKTGIDVELIKGKDAVINDTKRLTYGGESFYYKYKEAFEKDETLPKLTYQEFRTFVKTYISGVIERIVYEGFIFILPYYLGRLYFRKSNRVGFWNNKRMLNLHTFRKFYSLKWDKETAYFKNRTLWRYSMASYAKVCVMKAIRNFNKPILDAPLIAHDHNESKWT